jgi:hypothetical protein
MVMSSNCWALSMCEDKRVFTFSKRFEAEAEACSNKDKNRFLVKNSPSGERLYYNDIDIK